MMRTATFETRLLPDGHLDCPAEFARKMKARFQVTVTFESEEAADATLESAAAQDAGGDDFLSREEIDYYLGLATP